MEPDVIQIAPYVAKEEDFGPQLITLKSTNNVKELQTYLRDK